jgi:hypothetical protein
MSVVQSLVRLMRSHISNRQANHEDGSIRLNPNKSALSQCTLRERTVCDIHIYDVIPPNKAEKTSKKRIYYFAGGSWQEPPSPQHYKICAKLAKEMSDTSISIVSTPLAPNDPASKSFPVCQKTYRKRLEKRSYWRATRQDRTSLCVWYWRLCGKTARTKAWKSSSYRTLSQS